MLFFDYADATAQTAVYPGAGTGETTLAYVFLGLARAHIELGLPSPQVPAETAPALPGASVSELVVRAGPVAETVKKVIRDAGSQVTPRTPQRPR